MHRFVTDLTGHHPDITGPPDLGGHRRVVEGHGVDPGTLLAPGMGQAHLEILRPPVGQTLDKPDTGARRHDHRKGRQVLIAVHDPSGQQQVIQPDKVIGMVVGQQHGGELARAGARTQQTHHRAPTRIHLNADRIAAV